MRKHVIRTYARQTMYALNQITAITITIVISIINATTIPVVTQIPAVLATDARQTMVATPIAVALTMRANRRIPVTPKTAVTIITVINGTGMYQDPVKVSMLEISVQIPTNALTIPASWEMPAATISARARIPVSIQIIASPIHVAPGLIVVELARTPAVQVVIHK